MNKITLEINGMNIEYSIKPDIMWEVMLVQLRGIIINLAKKRKRQERVREKDLIKQITRIEESEDRNMLINIEQLVRDTKYRTRNNKRVKN